MASKYQKQLQDCFDYFNHVYFNDRLMDVTVRWSDTKKLKLKGEEVDAYCRDYSEKPTEIIISKRLQNSSWVWKIVLLHECVHADTYVIGEEVEDHHGPEFNQQMLRLAKAGAFDGIW